MGEAVADETKLALLGILLDGVEEFFLGGLQGILSATCKFATAMCSALTGFQCAYLLLGVGPAGNLNDHVENSLLSIGVERDIVERRDGLAILLDVHPVVQGEGLADLADSVGHCGRWRGRSSEVS